MSRETLATPGFGPAVYDTPSGAFAHPGSFARVIMRASRAALVRAGEMGAGGFAAIRRHFRYKKAIAELSALDDHMLKDLGIARDDIRRVVLGLPSIGERVR